MNKTTKEARVPLQLAVLNDIQEGLTNGQPLDDIEIAEFMNRNSTTTEVSSDNEMNVSDEETESSASLEGQKRDAFKKWIEEVSKRPRMEERGHIYLDADIIEIFVKIKKSTKIAVNHLIGCILTDWIMENGSSIQELLRKKNKLLNQIE